MRDLGSAARIGLRGSPLVPRTLSDALLLRLDAAAGWLVRARVSANAVTLASMALAAIGGVLLGFGAFPAAAPAMVLACLGDALDGLVARRSATSSIGGALLDASVDRYGEFFFLGGLAVCFRASAPILVLALLALAGSFMVSYASAKAEALRLSVPHGLMRRPERAICLCTGVALAAVLAMLARAGTVPAIPVWAARAPVVGALGLLAIFANASAIRRLRSLAQREREDASPAAASGERPVAISPRALERVTAANPALEPNTVAVPRALRAR
jgi:CDP-diacylglycerol--glycerol-3-phosphate 3-phosphatidyltransferase